MQKKGFPEGETYVRQHRFHKRWRKVIAMLGAAVVLCTAYALLAPAITLERTCRIPEHTHTDACYTQAPPVERTVLSCAAEVHTHQPGCCDASGALQCGYADFLVHTHDETCYDDSGALRCTLPEIYTHTHSEACYIRPQPHTHGAECYTRERGELLCQTHVHTEDCWAENRELACGLEESEEHTHEESCYRTTRELTCGVESDHVHTDDCYAWNEVLTCVLPEVPEDAAPALTCGKEEIVLHRHTADCFDGNGSLVCGRKQILQHQHGDECFTVEQIPSEEKLLTCTLEEHTHDESCGIVAGDTETTPEAPEAPETEPVSLPVSSGLPVLGRAYAAGNAYALMTMDMDAAEEEAQSDFLDVNGYITEGALFYRTSADGAWQNAAGAENIPGNAEFRLSVDYENVPIADLQASGGRMRYTLPEIFRDAAANGVIKDNDGNEIGTISAGGQTATIVFQQAWLEAQARTHTVIGGDFYVQGMANLSRIPGDGSTTVKIGSVTIELNFDNDLIARYGDVNIEKTVASRVIEKEDGDYLSYTLKVTAGLDGCPEVTVKDTFGSGSGWVDGYVLPEDSGAVVNEDGTMTWTLGEMQPNETRTLTYEVKLKPNYTGALSKGSIQNTAEVYSKTYRRDSDVATFTPRAGGTMSKVGSDMVAQEDGSTLITYYVWVQAYDTNSYTLDDLYIKDCLDGSIAKSTVTPREIRQYLSYVEDSFKLYTGGSNQQKDLTGLEPCSDEDLSPVITDNDGDEKLNDRFTCPIGALAPGESKTLVYSVKVEPGVYAAAGNGTYQINNRAEFHVEDSGTSGGGWINGYNSNRTFARKAWSRKLAGVEETQESVIAMDSSVYGPDGAAPDETRSFTVPAGSYRYQVLANEAGDWDLSSASLTDTLGDYMRFVGYVRVDAYHMDGSAPASSLDDAGAVNFFRNKTPNETFWVKIDDQQTFSVQPGILKDSRKHAYMLTYYARPVNVVNTVLVRNTFTITGTVGYGDYTYTLAGIQASAEVTVSGSNSFGAEKQAWYYEAPTAATGDFSTGAIYWVVKVEGSQLPQGLAIRDTAFRDTSNSNSKVHYMRGSSLVGVYTGSSELNVTAYENFAAVSGELEALTNGYDCTFSQNTTCTITFREAVTLPEGRSLYIILKTEPAALPQAKRDVYLFRNRLQTSSVTDNWVDHGVADEFLYGSDSVFKELANVFTYDGTSVTIESQPKSASVDASLLTGNGKYVDWLIHLNYEGTLSGKYRVVEQIPEGMELAYIRLYWYGDGYKTGSVTRPLLVQLEDLDAGWTHCQNTSAGVTSHYYVKGRQAVMDVTDLFPGGVTDRHAIEIQVVCKLTDASVLLGGETKSFNNEVRLLNSEGQEIGADSSGVALSVPGIRKGKDGTASVSGGKYPFVITINEKGIDLMPGAEKITLVDELGENLTIDTDSITVRNTTTDAALEKGQWQSSVENSAEGRQTLKIVLPDDQPLTISYSVTVNAPPNQTVTVTNSAHWQGYAATEGGAVEDAEFKYEAGGTAGAATTPKITVHKVDQYNNQLNLPGAEFTLTEMQLENGALVQTETSYTAVTDENGLLTCGETSDALLAYNRVYRIRETAAPQGYVLEDTPRYVLIAQAENGVYPDYTAYQALGVTIHYASPVYTYTAYNHRGEITVNKLFRNADESALDHRNGTYRFGLFADSEGLTKLQETYVTYAYGQQTAAAKFTDVELGKTYYVYELNDGGEPVRNGQPATVSGIPFVVSYDKAEVTVTADASGGEITVINRINYPELPRTGGTGRLPLYALGTVLMLGAAALLLRKRRGL